MSLIGLLMATEKQVPSGRPHETHPMAPEEPLAHPRIVGEDHPDSQVPSSPHALVVKGGKHPSGSILAPPASHGSDLYRRIK